MARIGQLAFVGWLFVILSCATAPTTELTIVKNGKPSAIIVAPAGGPPRYAAEVLQQTIKQMSGAGIPILSSSSSPSIIIRVTPDSVKHDGFHLFRNGDNIIIEASEPRGCIYGAYCFLEQLGCRFFGPEPLGVVIPKCETIAFPASLDIHRVPDFPNRFPSSGSPREIVQWGFNYCHPTTEARNLGLITYNFGHYWPDLLKNTYFADGRKPEKADFSDRKEWLPASKSGRRRNTGKSLCFSNPDALEWFTENAANFIIGSHKDADYFNLWSADESTIALCRCEKCSSAGYNDTDWYLITHNAIQKKLVERGWKGIFGWIAYHGSENPPTKVGLNDNGKMMDFLYAPRPRGGTLYGPSTNDHPASVKYRENLKQWKEYLDSQQYSGTRTVFEYYYDLVLLGPSAVGRAFLIPKRDVMQEDIRYYLDHGFDGFFDCNPPGNAWFPDPLNRWLYSRLLWDVNTNLAAATNDFYTNYYLEHANTIRKLRGTVEMAMFGSPSEKAVERLKELDTKFDALETNDLILAERIKVFRLWVQYCAMCKETELREKVTKDKKKVQTNEKAIAEFLERNRDFFLKNHIFASNDYGIFSYVTKRFHQ